MRDEIIEMAIEAGLRPVDAFTGAWVAFDEAIERFYDLAVQREREECCKVIDEIDDGKAPEYRACQEAIRARGEKQ